MRTITVNGMEVGLLYPLDAEAQLLINGEQSGEAIDRYWFVMIDMKDQTFCGFISRHFVFGEDAQKETDRRIYEGELRVSDGDGVETMGMQG